MTILVWLAGASVAVRELGLGLAWGLGQCGARVPVYDTALELEIEAAALKALEDRARAHGYEGPAPTWVEACYRASLGVYHAALREPVDWVIVVSGLYQPLDYLVGLRRAGLRVAVLLTESPYALDRELRLAARADAAIVMERSVLPIVRTVQPRAMYLPHGWDPRVHHPDGRADPPETPAHEAMCIGTGWAERVPWLAAVQAAGVDVALYGPWDRIPEGHPLRAAVRGAEVPNAQTAAYYRRATCVLNVHRRSVDYETDAQIARAESINPRVYEALACRTLPITDGRVEMAEAPGAYTVARDPAEMAALARRAIEDPVWRADRIAAGRAAIAEARWDRRAVRVIEALDRWRSSRHGAISRTERTALSLVERDGHGLAGGVPAVLVAGDVGGTDRCDGLR